MIGQMPRLRSLSRKRRTLPYTLPRRSRTRISKQAREPECVDTGRMLFDNLRSPVRTTHPTAGFVSSSELPRAEVVREPASFVELVVTGVARWFQDRLVWMRPRVIPLIVAAIGLGVTIEAVEQLSRPPAQQVSSVSTTTDSTYQPGRIRIVLQQ